MRLQPVFELARGQILNRDPVLTFDIMVSMVIVEETQMQSESTT